MLGKLGDDLLEEIELRPQRMQKNESRIFAGLDVAELVAIDCRLWIGISGAQRNFAGGFGFGLRASTTRDMSQNPVPTAAKITKAHRTEFIDLPSVVQLGIEPVGSDPLAQHSHGTTRRLRQDHHGFEDTRAVLIG